MEPKLSLLVKAILLAIYFRGFFSQKAPDTCYEGPFDCGSVRYISYPFWGGARTADCGRPGFEIICHGGVPMLNISSLTYRVQEMDFNTKTLKIAREDLWNTTCPKVIRNTTIDPGRFYYLSESAENNVTLYYDCSKRNGESVIIYMGPQPNQFNCLVKGASTMNFFNVFSVGPGPNITCRESISIPVSQAAAQSLENRTSSSINVLQTALASGFSVRWLSDGNELLVPFCNPNVYASCTFLVYSRSCIKFNNCRHDAGRLKNLIKKYWKTFLFRQGMPPESAQAPGYLPEGIPRESAQAPSYFLESGGDNRGTGQGKSPAIEIIIVVVLLSTTLVVIVFIVICCYLKRRNSQTGPNEKTNQDVESLLLKYGLLAPKRFKYSEIKKITKLFNEKLGKGGYGSVYKGILPDGSLVAVKVLDGIDTNGEEFINEVVSISRTSHVNIVNLLGFSIDGNKRALVYEFMHNNSLDKFITNDNCLDLEKLYEIAVGVAKGLEYLHTGCKTRIVHFDIKPQNILLDEDFCPKISDFGLAKLCKKKQSVVSVFGTRGTIGYIAPEVFSRNFGGVSHKSDVYSYGMMVLEMAGARKFVENEVIDQSSDNYFPDKIYEHVVDVTMKLDHGFIIDDEEEISRKMFLVGFWCIQTTPSNRPSMSKVVEMLEGSIDSILIPPKPILCIPNLPDKEISSFSAYVETENSAEC